MGLNIDQAKEIIKKPINEGKIASVKLVESQLRVLTEEMSLAELSTEPYWKTVKEQMKQRSSTKYERVLQFARYPLPVVQLSDAILNDFYKVFDGKNRYFNILGDRDISKLEQWVEDNALDKWIEKNARAVFKNKPNSFVVVDVNSEREPVLLFIDSDRLVDAQFKTKEGQLEYICFIHSQEVNPEDKEEITTFYSVYDDENYYVFSKNSKEDEIKEVTATKHQIGYCPATSFIKTPSNTKNTFKRRTAFSPALAKMEDWTLFDIYRNYVDHYAPFPVTEAPVKKCGNTECDNGVVMEQVIDSNNPGQFKNRAVVCHICEGGDKGKHIMPGSHIGLKVLEDKAANTGAGMFKMIFPDTDKLKYVPEKLDALELEIRFKSVGVNSMSNSEAFNELQVKGSFASMEAILLRTKDELDCVYTWIVKTVGLVYYKALKLNVEANFGTEFYLASESELQALFDNGKKIGLPTEYLMGIYRQIIETKYKGNSDKLTRNLMLIDLDPLPLYSIEDCINLKANGVIDDFDFSLKVNFLKFISKFESRNAPITQFGANTDYWTRIEAIRDSLFTYNQELIDAKAARAPKIETPKPGEPGEQ